MRPRKYQRLRPTTDGFTIVELVFVSALASLMLAMLASALIGAAHKARRIQCANNMHQLALALHNYHDTHRSLPPAWLCDRRNQKAPQWGWAVLILPVLEQSALHEALQPGPNSVADVFARGPTGEDELSCRISQMQCPSDRLERTDTARRFDRGVGVPQGWQAPRSNYVANVGFFCRTANYRNNGVMYGNSAIPMQAIVDGTSSTFLFGERDRLGGAGTWVGVAEPQRSGANGFGWVGAVVSVPMNSPTIEGSRDRGFSSQHPGGSQFAFCDGSVRFISETIDFNNGSANRLDSTSDSLLSKAEKARLGVYQRLGVRDDERTIVKMP